ncbi:hypothetical protein RCL1_006399 [Eukaryota sp. TZLM3-RCL]
MLWVDKYRPSLLQDLTYHQELSNLLDVLAHRRDLPHLLFYGPPGAGKKTRLLCLLREVVGASVTNVRVDSRSYKFGASSSTTVDVPIITSNHHIEVTPSELPRYDRNIVQELIKEVASSKTMDTRGLGFKVIVINEVDRLSRGAQHALRRTMEKYMSSCRLVLVASSLSRVLEPVRSRCVCIGVPAPKEEDILAILKRVVRKENSSVSDQFLHQIVENSDRNLRRALLSLELSHVSGTISRPDWEVYIEKIVEKVMQDQSPKSIATIRKMFYELLVHCVPADVIFVALTKTLISKVSPTVHDAILTFAATFQFNSVRGTKDIYHLEAFIVHVMAQLKRLQFGV